MPETEEEKQARLKAEEAAAAKAAKGGDEGGKGAAGKELKYDDNDMNGIVKSNLAKELAKLKSKYGDLDELKAKAEELDKLRDGGKSDIEKLTANLGRAEKKISELETAKNRAELQLQKVNVLLATDERFKKVGVVLERVIGTTEDEIKADIEKLKQVGFSLFDEGKGDGTGAAGAGAGNMQNKAAQGAGRLPPANKGGAGDGIKKFSRSQLRAMSKEEYALNRADILKATEAGLITQD